MKRKILVVDDNLDSLLILRSILEVQGFQVATANNGAAALEELQRPLPDLVLLDVMMPEMSGFEVLQRIKETHATSKIPVIMVTAKMQDEDVMTGYQYGADYYITKPCTAKQLLYGIELVLGRAGHAAAEGAAGAAAEVDGEEKGAVSR